MSGSPPRKSWLSYLTKSKRSNSKCDSDGTQKSANDNNKKTKSSIMSVFRRQSLFRRKESRQSSLNSGNESSEAESLGSSSPVGHSNNRVHKNRSFDRQNSADSDISSSLHEGGDGFILDTLRRMKSSGSGEVLESTAGLGYKFTLSTRNLCETDSVVDIQPSAYDPEYDSLKKRMDQLMSRTSMSPHHVTNDSRGSACSAPISVERGAECPLDATSHCVSNKSRENVCSAPMSMEGGVERSSDLPKEYKEQNQRLLNSQAVLESGIQADASVPLDIKTRKNGENDLEDHRCQQCGLSLDEFIELLRSHPAVTKALLLPPVIRGSSEEKKQAMDIYQEIGGVSGVVDIHKLLNYAERHLRQQEVQRIKSKRIKKPQLRQFPQLSVDSKALRSGSDIWDVRAAVQLLTGSRPGFLYEEDVAEIKSKEHEAKHVSDTSTYHTDNVPVPGPLYTNKSSGQSISPSITAASQEASCFASEISLDVQKALEKWVVGPVRDCCSESEYESNSSERPDLLDLLDIKDSSDDD